MLSNGEVKRPERPCPHDLHDLREDGFASCPYHGLVLVVVDDLTGKFDRIMDETIAEAKANGKKKSKRKKQRCPFCGSKVNPGPDALTKVGPALYAYQPCGCEVQFNAEGYPRKPKSRG